MACDKEIEHTIHPDMMKGCITWYTYLVAHGNNHEPTQCPMLSGTVVELKSDDTITLN